MSCGILLHQSGRSKGIDIYRIAAWLGDDVRVVQRHYAKLRTDAREIMGAFKVSAEFTSVSPPFNRSMHASRSRVCHRGFGVG
jgi:hypothetical protein